MQRHKPEKIHSVDKETASIHWSGPSSCTWQDTQTPLAVWTTGWETKTLDTLLLSVIILPNIFLNSPRLDYTCTLLSLRALQLTWHKTIKNKISCRKQVPSYFFHDKASLSKTYKDQRHKTGHLYFKMTTTIFIGCKSEWITLHQLVLKDTKSVY